MTRDASKNDPATVAAIAVIAMCVVTLDHEALGHGGVCLALGGHIEVLTSSIFQCDLRSPWIAPAGPAGNLLMGTLALILSRFTPAKMAGCRLFLLLVAAFSYFWEGGYAVQAMIERRGDLYSAGEDLFGEPSRAWRVVGSAAGASLYLSAIWLSRAGLLALWPDPSRARRVARTAWLAATLAAIAAALVCRIDPPYDLHDAFAEIGLASFPLLLLPRGSGRPAAVGAVVARDARVIALAVLVFAAFVGTLGRGIGAAVAG